MGGQWSIAWRVFDAQFWGVPQRRKRIALVADFGGLTAPEILFERPAVLPFVPSPPQSDIVVFEPGSCSRVGGHIWQDGKTPALRAQSGDNQPAIALENHPADSRVKIAEDGIVQTLNARMGTGGGECSPRYVYDPRFWNIATPEQPMFTLLATSYKDPPVVIMEVQK